MKKASHIKIIGGKFRSRIIEFPDTMAIRPTPNRVRETVFNWLMEWTREANCLDAFSGSGALAFEAISRGAKTVTAFEKDARFATAIQDNAKKLGVENFHLIQADFFSTSRDYFYPPYDIVFLDPPFQQNLLPKALHHLVENHLLAKEHRIYFEVEKTFDVESLPKEVEMLKNQTAGQVRFGLLKIADNKAVN